jgi:transcriptional regulator with XRE-family HTH domain
MQALRGLRSQRALTILDLASLTMIPARQIAELEFGLRRPQRNELDTLALVLGVQPHDLIDLPPPRVRSSSSLPGAPALTAVALAASLAGTMLQGEPPALAQIPTISQFSQQTLLTTAIGLLPDSISTGSAAASFIAHTSAPVGVAADSISPPISAPAPVEAAEDEIAAFVLDNEGPWGCPIRTEQGVVVLTQGYGVGSHTPIETWGAVDLAVDSNGDGQAEPEATWYAPVVATHAGVVHVTLNSDPGGNHVWIEHQEGVWRSGYAHLALATVIDGQTVRPGEVIGLVGSSGYSTGPHLDYQVWRGNQNIDPTRLVGACR